MLGALGGATAKPQEKPGKATPGLAAPGQLPSDLALANSAGLLPVARAT